ncbi:MAG: helical backbone metal receptor [Deltaproteobacteria bacterium]|jgi:iron complex transport system substrate-binding protein|nr:helical backbone metal receptor [Deltaproteobacteria bacterium]
MPGILKPFLYGTVFSLALGFTVWLHLTLAARTAPKPAPLNPRRIITLSPSVTETVCALGLCSRVIGVTKYCRYPPEVADRPAVATFSELNYEAIVRLKPDLIVSPADKETNSERLSRLGLTVLTLDTGSLDGYLAQVLSLGRALGREKEARNITGRLTGSFNEARLKSRGRPKPTVLFSIMHNYEGLGYITEINAVGRDGFFSRLLEDAGGINVYRGPLPFPRLSRESIIFLNPEVIVDIILETEDLSAVLKDWQSLGTVPAVKNDRVYFLTEQSDTVPGPRIYQTVDRLSALLFPDI